MSKLRMTCGLLLYSALVAVGCSDSDATDQAGAGGSGGAPSGGGGGADPSGGGGHHAGGAPTVIPPFGDRTTIEVLDSTISAVSLGEGPTVVFVHGNPVSAYVWRNVMSAVGDRFRAVAPDLIGMGESGKPAIGYSMTDHAAYFAAWMDAFPDTQGEVILVMHDWGGVVGMDWARAHEDRVRGLVFSDIWIKTYPAYEDLGPYIDYELLRSSQFEALVLENNILVEQLLPQSILRTLSDVEMDAYRAPFPTPESRIPTLKFIQGWPVANTPVDVVEAVDAYRVWLAETPVPKLLLTPEHAPESFEMITAEDVVAIGSDWPNVTVTPLPLSGHFVQEDHPEEYGQAILDWADENAL
jgi:haloalkane dehalogenase